MQEETKQTVQESKLKRSRERLKQLLESNAPDLLIFNECSIFIKRYLELKGEPATEENDKPTKWME